MIKQRWFRAMARLVERLTIPGIVLHYALRKTAIRRLTRQAIETRANQLVVLGAGYDSIAADFSQEFTNLQVWEIDHPATQKCKALALDFVNVNAVNLVPADLSKIGPRQILTEATRFRSGLPTVWIAEGLLMYFDESIVARVFQQTATISAPGSRFIFTFMRPDRSNRLRFEEQTPLVDWWLKYRGEPFHWGMQPDLLPDFIRPWHVLEITDDNSLKQTAQLGSNKSAIGEMICFAEL
jgi:methyltransferase (TIGR00027 family)